MKIKFLGFEIGECDSKFVMMEDMAALEILYYRNVIPNENIYIFFPSFPKETTLPNELRFNLENGELLLYEQKYEKHTGTTLKLTNLIGDKK